jgi:transposase
MIAVPAGMRVLVATRPVDFRKGADGLVALVSETLGNERVKILVRDGSGLCCIGSGWSKVHFGGRRSRTA